MTQRLRAEDLAFWLTDSASTPMHNATLEIFEPRGAFDHDRLRALVADRLAFVPRYRQVVRTVPGRLANPVWADDEDFDLSYHVRRSALPRPGSIDQLRDLTARIMSRRLDPHRPLWETYLVEGLAGGRFAILSKSHQLLVDGVATIDLGQVILDVAPDPTPTPHVEWSPRPAPTGSALVLQAVRDSLLDPWAALATLGDNAALLLSAAGAVRGRLSEVAGLVTGRGGVAATPITTRLSEQRRFMTVSTSLEDYRRVRRCHGGTVNDVILATVTGAMRSWLMTRAEPVPASRSLRAMVPVSVIDSDLEPTSLGSQVAGHILSLPIGEPDPVVRLHQVSYALKAHTETGRAVAADRLAGVAGFAPTTFHALGSRLAAAQVRRGFDVVVTNVPGPQFPLYAAGAQMTESYPVPPLLPGHALSVGVTSYDGGVYVGLTGDRDALPDLDVLGQCVEEALEELVDSASSRRAPQGRQDAQGRRAPQGRRDAPVAPGVDPPTGRSRR